MATKCVVQLSATGRLQIQEWVAKGRRGFDPFPGRSPDAQKTNSSLCSRWVNQGLAAIGNKSKIVKSLVKIDPKVSSGRVGPKYQAVSGGTDKFLSPLSNRSPSPQPPFFIA